MRRYLPLLLMSFFLVVLVIVGTTLLAGHAGNQNLENPKKIVVYTTLPLEQVTVLASEYEKRTGVKVILVPLAPTDVTAKVKHELGTERAADLVLAYRTTLQELKKNKLATAYSSETTDVVPAQFSDSDCTWVGIWYDPIVFAANKDFIKNLPQAPTRWSDLSDNNNYRLVITDFLAADASANLLYTMAEVNGETDTLSYFAKLHPKIIQYVKFLRTPPRMAGMGEADIAIAVQSETLRYVKEGFPVQIIYPEDGTAYLLSGIALAAKAPHDAEAKRFIDWLLHNIAQNTLHQNHFYFVPTNPEIKAYKELNADKITLFKYQDNLSPEQKAKLLDLWMHTVRLNSL